MHSARFRVHRAGRFKISHAARLATTASALSRQRKQNGAAHRNAALFIPFHQKSPAAEAEGGEAD